MNVIDQDDIDRADRQHGGLFLPGGTFTVASTLHLPDGFILRGRGPNRTRLVGDGITPVIRSVDSLGLSIEDIWVDGDGDPRGVRNDNTGLALPGAQGCTIRGVIVTDCGGYGISFGGNGAVRCRLDTVVVADVAGDGIDVKNSSDDSEVYGSGLWVERWGLGDNDYSDKAGIDIRGIAHLSGVNVAGATEATHCVGIRFRESGRKHGPGAYGSTLTGFYAAGCRIGVSAASPVGVSNGTTVGCVSGLETYSTGVRFSGVLVEDCRHGVTAREQSTGEIPAPVDTVATGCQFHQVENLRKQVGDGRVVFHGCWDSEGRL